MTSYILNYIATLENEAIFILPNSIVRVHLHEWAVHAARTKGGVFDYTMLTSSSMQQDRCWYKKSSSQDIWREASKDSTWIQVYHMWVQPETTICLLWRSKVKVVCDNPPGPKKHQSNYLKPRTSK